MYHVINPVCRQVGERQTLNLKNMDHKSPLQIGLYLAILVATGILTHSCANSLATDASLEKKEVGIPVTLAKVEFDTVAFPVHVSGNLQASRESRLSFKTGGIIKLIKVHEGDKVKSGDLLAKLDLKEINQQVMQARVGLDKANRDFERIQNLYNDSVATLEQMQNAKSAFEVARANMNIAEYNLKYSSITAPCDGIILKKFMEESEITGPGMPVFYFASDEDSWRMTVGVSDKSIVKISMGDKAQITTDAFPDQILGANVSKIANAPDPKTGLYEIELSVEETSLELKPGFFARGDIYPSKTLVCGKIPVEAVQEGFGKTISFYVLDEDTQKAKLKEAEVLFLQNNFVYVAQNSLDPNARVIMQRQKEIKNNDKVSAKSLLAKR